ncbi:MAG TPA: lanthionine synthetase C family protein, partial [Thermoanaerobaculia bacterium]|nr:lanthionine synthetase C family protein [Thermoanaerobaculia bacterium]
MAPWQRLLEDRDAERAWKVIDDIAQALRPAAENIDPTDDPGVAVGTAGVALFYAYMGAETGSEEWTGLADRLMEHSIDALSDRPLLPDFYEGFTGIGWALGQLQGMLFEEPDDDEDPDADPIGESLVEVLRGRTFARGDFDLIGGLAGYGIYAFHALPRPAARRALELLVQRLVEIGEPVDGGFSWFTPPEVLPDWLREKEPDGRYNLGVSHGVAAVISVLSMCAAAGVMSGEQRATLDRAVDWLLAQKQNGKQWCFANSVVKGRPAGRDRLAWCYGDPGIAAALFTAARHCGHAGWEAVALEIAQSAARRPLDDSSEIVDAALCHGSAGLAHLFNRMHQASGDPLLAEAARAWYRYTVDMQRPGVGIAGYEFFAAPGWLPLTGYLPGLAGVGLGLLAGVSSREPAWDQFLAVSVPLESSTPRSVPLEPALEQELRRPAAPDLAE